MTEQEIVQTGGASRPPPPGGEAALRTPTAGAEPGLRGVRVRAADRPEANASAAGEAVALLTARQCPPGVTTVILDGSRLALQVHESCGHPIELDRVFGSAPTPGRLS